MCHYVKALGINLKNNYLSHISKYKLSNVLMYYYLANISLV